MEKVCGDVKRFKIESGALIEVPVYENHHRGKNWLAKIQKDPKSPGGLNREFMETAKGNYYYFVEGLVVGDIIEFGADYYSAGGRKNPNRMYGIVKSLTDSELEVELYSDSEEAFKKKSESNTDVILEPENPLAKFTDEELIAEVKKRGLR